LKVALLSLPPRTQAVLEFFFTSTGRTSFAPSSEIAADVAVFDVDTVESMQRWNDFHARTSKPGIALSVTPHQIDGAVWVQKPVTPAALLAAAASLNAGKWYRADGSGVAAVAKPAAAPEPVSVKPNFDRFVTSAPVQAPPPAPPVVETPRAPSRPDFGGLMRQVLSTPTEPAAAPAPAAAPVAPPVSEPVREEPKPVAAEVVQPVVEAAVTAAEPAHGADHAEAHAGAPVVHMDVSEQEKRDEALLCGSWDDVSAVQLASDTSLRYDPNQYLIAALKEAYLVSAKWRVPTQFDTSAGVIVVDTLQNLVYMDFEEAQLAPMYRQRIAKRPKTRVVSAGDFAKMRPRFESQGSVVRADALLWRAAMLTAEGRLPSGVSPDRPIYLKQWPNMTRLQRTPHSLRIAAAWAIKGASIEATARLLNIPQRYVFAFYNAALELDLVTEDGSHIHRARSNKGPRNRGLLTRLFNWLGK
jgi:hypothetical protein